jgi:thiamine biosynthesis protein ThiS
MITVNSKPIAYESQSVSELLAALGYPTTWIAVERNGEILPKALYQQTQVEDHDVFEVVSFVGGG